MSIRSIEWNHLTEKYGGQINLRDDGRIEWVCKHGVGHTIAHTHRNLKDGEGIHGCDGCCKQIRKQIKVKLRKYKFISKS